MTNVRKNSIGYLYPPQGSNVCQNSFGQVGESAPKIGMCAMFDKNYQFSQADVTYNTTLYWQWTSSV